jgi:hypothetical protein
LDEAVRRLLADEPRYVPPLGAACAVAAEFAERGWPAFTAKDVHRMLEEWGEPVATMPSLTRLVTLGLLERVPPPPKTPRYRMPRRQEIEEVLTRLGKRTR